MKLSVLYTGLLLAALGSTLTGCADLKTPATASIAVSKNAIDNADSANAAQLAPAEIQSARDKLTRANAAFAKGDYQAANELALAAQADANVAKSKATSQKAQNAADAVSKDQQVLQDELNRKNNP